MIEAEKILISQIQEGSEKAYHFLFKEYYAILSVFAKKYTGDLDSAKDIVQDVFVKLFEQRECLLIHTSLKSYLYQSVRNRSLNYLEHIQIDQKHKSNILYNLKDENEWSDKMLELELEAKIHSIISTLPEQRKNIFTLSRVQGLKNKEIAEQLNISIRTVEKQISNALKALRENLSDYLKLLIYLILGTNL